LVTNKKINWADTRPPSRSAAIERVAAVQPHDYARTRNHINGAVTGLSPYLTHGLITLRDALANVVDHEPLHIEHKFVFELGWREFFRHVWANAGDEIFSSLHAGPLADEAYVTILPADIRQACTGVPVIDEAVRTLYATGTLHNHARMWLASYCVHVRRVHWRAGADWLVAHLLDGDLASNHLSWQWVAGTGSHKPYLFNADNVARYAPPSWHSPGSIIDTSYEEMDRIAHCAQFRRSESLGRTMSDSEGALEPALHARPPESLPISLPAIPEQHEIKGKSVWLVHPWALRAPPADMPPDTVVIGVYLREHHDVWPWPQARWEWVDAAMASVTARRWWADAASLAAALSGATCVRGSDDPHITRWLKPIAHLDAAPSLFPPVKQRCKSFSQWWRSATHGLKNAKDLL
jgi:deoxyribodipyrimidine photo-lyase